MASSTESTSLSWLRRIGALLLPFLFAAAGWTWIAWLEAWDAEASPAPEVANTLDIDPPTDPISIDARRAEKEGLLAEVRSGRRDFVGVLTIDGTDTEFDSFAAAIGREPDIAAVSIGWERDRYDPTLLPRLSARGSIPMISWEPWDFVLDTPDQPRYALARILGGDFDDYIDEWARGIAAFEQPVLIRFAHEANGDWYPWAADANGNSAAEYRQVWRYLHRRVSSEGASNAIWVWSPNVDFDGESPVDQLYPGDDYVDVAGMVGYFGHFGSTPDAVWSFDQLFGPTIEQIRSVTDRPILISETGASDIGGFKAVWIELFLAEVAERSDVVGFVWFEAVKEDDWRVGSSPESVDAFVDGLLAPSFRR